MFSGVYSSLQKNAELKDLYTAPSMIYCLGVSLCGNQTWVKEYMLSDLIWINMTDIATGVLFQHSWNSYIRKGIEPRLVDRIVYSFFQALATLTATSMWMYQDVPLNDLSKFTPIAVGMVGYGFVEGVAKESLRLYVLNDLKNREREEQGFSLAENYMRQAEYMYSGAEKTHKLQQALDIYDTYRRSHIFPFHYNRDKLNHLLRKEEFRYI